MSSKTLIQKLAIKPNTCFVLLHAPEGYLALLGDLPDGVILHQELVPEADIIQFFTTERTVLELQLPVLKQALKPKGILWVTYPKGTSGVATDLSREIIWQMGEPLHLKPVGMVAVDQVWSAFRFKIG
jgi:hypothetical protein